MPLSDEFSPPARVGSLHLHPRTPGRGMVAVKSMELLEGMGIVGNDRYFSRRQRSTDRPSVRQVSLMERELIERHGHELGISPITPGAVRANIETIGIDLVSSVGRRLQIGSATLLICEPRLPCAKMDEICQGLRALMEGNRQGVLAQVLHSGIISEGDKIVSLSAAPVLA